MVSSWHRTTSTLAVGSEQSTHAFPCLGAAGDPSKADSGSLSSICGNGGGAWPNGARDDARWWATWRRGPRATTMAAVPAPGAALAVEAVPAGVVYSVLLLIHVACAVVGFGALATTGLQARRARRGPGAPAADAVRRYFRPGVNWAARALYGVPVFGFALIAASDGAFASGDGFVVAGLGLWALSTLVAEAVVWPAERRIQAVVSEGWAGPGEGDPGDDGRRLERDCRHVTWSAALLCGVFVLAVALMIARP